MKELERAALYSELIHAIEEIDAIFESYGFDPSDYDPDNLDYADIPELDLIQLYGHIHNFKEAIEQ